MNSLRDSSRLSGATIHTTSPGTPSDSRLVARIRRPGQRPSNPAASSAQAPTTCSQLSSTISNDWSASHSASAASDLPGLAAVRPIASATAAATAARSPTEPRSANATVPAERARRRRATSIASRVLPTPPGPVSVTSRDRCNSSRTSATARSRPTKLVNGTGSQSRRSGSPRTPGSGPPPVRSPLPATLPPEPTHRWHQLRNQTTPPHPPISGLRSTQNLSRRARQRARAGLTQARCTQNYQI